MIAAPAAPAVTVTSPWPAAAGNWVQRRDEDVVLQVWRLIANAGPKGISKAALRDRLNAMEDAALTLHVQELRKKGHARFEGVNGSTKVGVWVATPTPWPNEMPPAWIAGLTEHDTDEPLHKPDAADKTVQAARQVPASVFALGVKIAGEVDIDAVHRKQADAPAAAPATTPAPAPADPAGAVEVLVALDSQGHLLVHEETCAPVILSATATRVLFGYLDRTIAGFGVLTEALP